MSVIAHWLDGLAAAWHTQNNRIEVLPDLATAALRELEGISLDTLVHEAMGASLPDQPPQSGMMVLHRAGNLEVGLNLQEHPDTAYLFSNTPAAFRIVAGECVVARYHFESGAWASALLQEGAFAFRSVEHLAVGGVCALHARGDSVVAIAHLAPLTASLWVRMRSNASYVPIEAVHAPHFIRGQSDNDWVVREKQLIRMLASAKSPLAMEALLDLARDGRPEDSLQVLEHLALQLSAEQLRQLVEVVREHHGPIGDRFLDVLGQSGRHRKTSARLQTAKTPVARYLWALLSLVPSWPALFEAVGKRFPGETPVKVVAAWLQDEGLVEGRDDLSATLDALAEGKPPPPWLHNHPYLTFLAHP